MGSIFIKPGTATVLPLPFPEGKAELIGNEGYLLPE